MVHEGYACNPTAVYKEQQSCCKDLESSLQPGLSYKDVDCWYLDVDCGILIRDHGGQVLAAQCVKVQYHPRGVHPKFYAYVHALMFALEMSFAEIIVEGPPFHPVDTLKNRPSGPTIGDSWLKEIWVLIQKFRRCSLSFVSPEINKGAWILAKFGSTIKESRIWIEEVPVMLQDVL
uniref:RNase H type-1 domain-containing protein n=1 Tax=Fagus sylvatica TaxID=28930 RepID=A0A2N9G4A9_FAGSY